MSTAEDRSLRTRIVEGENALARLGECAAPLGRRALVVTDPGLCATGHVERAEESLRAAGVESRRFAEVRENPTTEDVERCVSAARAYAPDLLVGLGGGSSIDVAKGANFLLAGGGVLEDYQGVGKAKGDLLPLIAVPTTAGTGSEVQSFALIARAGNHQKMACGDERAAPRVALLDPELTLTMPAFVTAITGLDAIAHAVETMVTTEGGSVSTALACASFALSVEAFPRVLAAPEDLAARASMLRASCLAGRAIENSMLGAAHAMANPLTARHGIPHGQAVGMCLPVVVRHNAEGEKAAASYAECARAAGLDDVEALVDALRGFVTLAGLPASLADCGVGAGAVDALGREAAAQWTARYNPRAIDARGFADLFREAGAR